VPTGLKAPPLPPDDVLARCPAEVVAYVRAVDEILQKLIARDAEQEKKIREGKRSAGPFRRDEKSRTPKGKRKKSGRKGGHSAHRRSEPEHIDEHLDAPVSTNCGCGCGGTVVEVGEYEQIQEDIQIQRVVRKLTIHVGNCTKCGQVVEGRHPFQTSTARGAAAHQIGPTALALAAQLHYQQGVPFAKIADLLGQVGLPIASSTLVRAMHRIANHGEAAFQELLSSILAARVMHIDETSWLVDGEPHYLWVLTDEKTTVYFVRRSRSGDEITDFLKDFRGVFVTDGYAGYDQLGGKLLRALCHLHLKRNMKTLEAKVNGRAKGLARDLEWWLEGSIALVGARSEMGAKAFAQQAEELEAQYFEILSRTSCYPENERMIARLLKWQDAVLRCLRNPDVPATNNRAERQVRPAVVLRKRGGCNDTERGARTFERLGSIAETLRGHKLKFMDWVVRLLRSPVPISLFG
jgi:transposase